MVYSRFAYAIITNDAFRLAQIELKRRREPRGKHFNSPLTSRLVCGECGAHYNHRSRLPEHEEKRFDLWACDHGFKQPGSCLAPMVSDRKIKRATVAAVNHLFGDYTFDLKKYQREVLAPTFSDSTQRFDQILNHLSEHLEPIQNVATFDGHIVFSLIDSLKVKADNALIVQFKNNRKELINLKSI